jgi:hypothetical protein|tara:strand:- start:5421 stop:6017 length:597 start_codon:yes stop_codon:yes gene_type:complete
MIMKNTSPIVIVLFLLISSCSGSGNGIKAKKIGDGVYEQGSWIFDLKQLPNGEDIAPYYTVGKLSSNVIFSTGTDGSVIEMGVTFNFKIGKDGSDKGKIIGAYFESTSTNEDEFKFPRCLSICPVNIEILDSLGTVKTKSMYSRNNVFQMQLEDDVINKLALEGKVIRVRIPVSARNQNTTFELFKMDLSDYTSELNF